MDHQVFMSKHLNLFFGLCLYACYSCYWIIFSIFRKCLLGNFDFKTFKTLFCFFWVFWRYFFNSIFYYFSLTNVKLLVAKIKPLSQLPYCQNATRKSFSDVVFTDFSSKSQVIGQLTVHIRLWFFAKTCLMTVMKISQNLGTLPSTVLNISQKDTE